jgi:hypothetical protein
MAGINYNAGTIEFREKRYFTYRNERPETTSCYRSHLLASICVNAAAAEVVWLSLTQENSQNHRTCHRGAFERRKSPNRRPLLPVGSASITPWCGLVACEATCTYDL